MPTANALVSTTIRPDVTPPTPDAELAERAAGGDDRAFEAIMRRHNRLLFRTARSILRSDAESEDALQEAYLRAWRALAGDVAKRRAMCTRAPTRRPTCARWWPMRASAA